MKRFCVFLILVGGLAMGDALSAAEVIRGGGSEDRKMGAEKFSKAVVRHPASMGNSRGQRYQKLSTLPRFLVSRKKTEGAAVKVVRSTEKKSTVSLRKFPVVKLSSSTLR